MCQAVATFRQKLLTARIATGQEMILKMSTGWQYQLVKKMVYMYGTVKLKKPKSWTSATCSLG